MAFFACGEDSIGPIGGIGVQNEKARTSVSNLGMKSLEILDD
jgi:hypothetical protein